MGKFPYLMLVLTGLVYSPGAAFAAELPEEIRALETICLPANANESKVFLSTRKEIITQNNYPHEEKLNNQNRLKQLMSLNRDFGPLALKLNVNPFNMNRTGLVFNLDLIKSYEIISSRQVLAIQ